MTATHQETWAMLKKCERGHNWRLKQLEAVLAVVEDLRTEAATQTDDKMERAVLNVTARRIEDAITSIPYPRRTSD